MARKTWGNLTNGKPDESRRHSLGSAGNYSHSDSDLDLQSATNDSAYWSSRDGNCWTRRRRRRFRSRSRRSICNNAPGCVRKSATNLSSYLVYLTLPYLTLRVAVGKRVTSE